MSTERETSFDQLHSAGEVPEYRCISPVVFLVFNRPDQTKRVFERIAQSRPPRLLVVADGPRESRAGEKEVCAHVREIASGVDWPCEVQTNFSDVNLGCRRRVISGLNWAFEQVEEAIILEDDILPDSSFFRFCDEMLAKSRGDSRISMITGFNIVEQHVNFDWSYFFSRLTHIWGWATWRSSWARYDERLDTWPAVRRAGLIREYFRLPEQQQYWTNIFDSMHAGTGPDTWDYQWFYTNMVNHALSVVPRSNLVENIGFGAGATHTVEAMDSPAVPVRSLRFPLVDPPAMTALRRLDELDGRISRNYIPTLRQRVARRVRKTLLAAPRGSGS